MERFRARRDVIVELVLVTSIIASFIWFGRRAFPGSTQAFALVLMAALASSHRRRGDSLRDLGFRLDTALRAALLFAPVAIAVLGITLAVGGWMQSIRFPSLENAVGSVASSLAFGIAQQYVLLGFFYRGIASLVRVPAVTVLLTALVFSAFHMPNAFLMTVTFFAAAVAAMVYRVAPNLWVTGIAHALISLSLYYSLPRTLTHSLRVGPDY